MGSTAFADNISDRTSVYAERLLGAGGILLGKTTSSEFGNKALCDGPLFGETNNPWKLTHVSGGSSGGAAAAVACGLGPLAQAGDAAGSIRVPASCCGVVGLKPSFGRVPLWPDFSPFETAIHNGPIARTVADCALMLQVMAGPHLRDVYSIEDTSFDFPASVRVPDVRGLRVAYSRTFGFNQVEAEVVEITDRAAQVFRDLGAIVEEADPDVPDPREPEITFWRTFEGVLANDLLIPASPRPRSWTCICASCGSGAADLGLGLLPRHGPLPRRVLLADVRLLRHLRPHADANARGCPFPPSGAALPARRRSTASRSSASPAGISPTRSTSRDSLRSRCRAASPPRASRSACRSRAAARRRRRAARRRRLRASRALGAPPPARGLRIRRGRRQATRCSGARPRGRSASRRRRGRDHAPDSIAPSRMSQRRHAVRRRRRTGRRGGAASPRRTAAAAPGMAREVVVAVPLGLVDPERRDHRQVGEQAHRADRGEILRAVDERVWPDPSRRSCSIRQALPMPLKTPFELLNDSAVVARVEGARDRVERVVRLVDDEPRPAGPRGEPCAAVSSPRARRLGRGCSTYVDATGELGRRRARHQLLPERAQRRRCPRTARSRRA